MINRVGSFVLVSILGVGCGVGDDAKVEPIDPNPNNLVCTDAFKITGTFTAGLPARPLTDAEGAPFTGCWPYGTWNFTVTRDTSEENIQDITGDQKGDRCGAVPATQAATFDASYSFTVTQQPDANVDFIDIYTLAGQTVSGGKTFWNDKVVFKTKVTEGGGGECEAGIELYDRSGTSYWNLHPALTGNTVSGFGDFGLYEDAQI
jgi:hypothetical protein